MVSNLVKQFEQMRKMLKHNGLLNRLMAGEQMPSGGLTPGAYGSIFDGGGNRVSKKEQEHKKRLAKLAKKQRQKQRKRKK